VPKADPTRPSDATVKRLYARSGNRCAFPKCTIDIVQGDTLVGEVCHIKAARPGGPRYDKSQTAAGRHGDANLIILCGVHHTVVDADEEAYTVDRLLKMKIDHEQNTAPLAEARAASGTQLLINQSVSAINQSGGITAHTVNIYAGAPPPSSPSPTPQPPPFPEAPVKDPPARFRGPGEPIGKRWDLIPFAVSAGNPVTLAAGPAMWLRLMPLFDPGRRWTSQELRHAVERGVMLQPFIWTNLFAFRAEDCTGTCALLSAQDTETNSVVAAFETGEVWAVDTWMLVGAPEHLLTIDIEQTYTERLPQYARFLETLGLQPPYRWIAGLTGVKNRLLQFPPPRGQMTVPGWVRHECLAGHIISFGTYDPNQSPTSALLPFFCEIFAKCGLLRPDYLTRTSA
jgi:hypothetical protein